MLAEVLRGLSRGELRVDDDRLVGVPRSVEATLRARNLVPTRVSAPDLGTRRSTADRLAALRVAHASAAWVLLVEVRARFFSQLGGRYRWDVAVKTSLVQGDGAPQVSDLDVAAFLTFEHQREAEALDFVRRQLVSDVAALLDRVLPAAH